MARIEISLDEYNSLKNKKKELEAIIGNQKEEIASLKEKKEEYKELLKDISELKFFERTIHWKSTIGEINKTVKD